VYEAQLRDTSDGLHQTVIIAIAFVVVGWQADITVKFVASLMLASLGRLLIYEFAMRRYTPARSSSD
jgi:hypothetical protein